MIRPPPRSTLFPYTTSSDLDPNFAHMGWAPMTGAPRCPFRATRKPAAPAARRRSSGDWPARSEEHTSELQSRRDLVCRLLLEKKKKNYKDTTLRINTPEYYF